MHICRMAATACLGAALLAVSAPAKAQYQLTNLVSNQVVNQVGLAPNIDPLLENAWGLARSATSPWWISDNVSGWSTLYNAAGQIQSLKVLIPTAGNGPASPTGGNGPGQPTGIVANPAATTSTDFQVQGKRAAFIFATLDGTISAWAPGVNANETEIVADNSAGKASYTGLAVTSRPSGNNLYAADNANNVIDMFDSNFNLVKQFSDPAIPANFSVFGIQDINGIVYVTYAIPNIGAGGFVDQFQENGTLIKTLIHGLPLNQAWGIALAPSNFGPLSNTLLVSNNAIDGTINAFNPTTGLFVGTIREHGRRIVLNNLWGVAFGGGATNNGPTNTLFVTVGPGIGATSYAGTFASIVFNPNDHDHDHDGDDDGGGH